MTLGELIRIECSNCQYVAAVWISKTGPFVTIQLPIGRHEKTDKHWKIISPKYCASSEALRQVNSIASRLREKYPDLSINIVSYKFFPGSSQVEVYRARV